MEVRNSLVVLSSVAKIKVFPKFDTHGQEIQKRVEVLLKSERNDIKLMSTSYSALLKANESSFVEAPDDRKTKTPRIPAEEPSDTANANPNDQSDGAGAEESRTKNIRELKKDVKLSPESESHGQALGGKEEPRPSAATPKEEPRIRSPKRRRAEDDDGNPEGSTIEDNRGSKRFRPRDGTDNFPADDDSLKRRPNESRSPVRNVDVRRPRLPREESKGRGEYGPSRPISPRGGSLSRTGSNSGGPFPRDRHRERERDRTYDHTGPHGYSARQRRFNDRGPRR
eukprot:Plantae.Rhodophyta-Purpureofilum_apyrenoidigerum.ctg45567.p1 GENE.Plantae.Rhodophyta-Purpureofilum_apyrenoidigerum.ctg45567~~Plantae.Rhodophyta-Purpureofilum_apyrenoidigerum.ctg45567.p1  ORF type:complete len:283 (-),score=29.39 Plantae.Rhodophyta-Purpureofilum_apyrenoidigerum.ctg45567:128-976(-)